MNVQYNIQDVDVDVRCILLSIKSNIIFYFKIRGFEILVFRMYSIQ